MKIRRLPDLDLARIAPLAEAEKRRALEAMKLKFPPHSYEPFRECVPAILNLSRGGLFPEGSERVAWEAIEGSIKRRSRARKPSEEPANLAVARGLYYFANERKVTGRYHPFPALALGPNQKISYWSSGVINLDGRPTVVSFDPRKTNSLTAEGRRFVFSVMHERIRVGDPDFADVALVIVKFDASKGIVRYPCTYSADRTSLFDAGELEAMVRDTYQMWIEVLTERAAEAARKATGTGGLFD